jgi:hypothetical protein
MRFLLFNFDDVDEIFSDLSALTDEEFEKYAQRSGGYIIENVEDFEARFNAEHFSTATHQLRILK